MPKAPPEISWNPTANYNANLGVLHHNLGTIHLLLIRMVGSTNSDDSLQAPPVIQILSTLCISKYWGKRNPCSQQEDCSDCCWTWVNSDDAAAVIPAMKKAQKMGPSTFTGALSVWLCNLLIFAQMLKRGYTPSEVLFFTSL